MLLSNSCNIPTSKKFLIMMNLISHTQVQLIFIKRSQVLRTRTIDEKYQYRSNPVYNDPEVRVRTLIFLHENHMHFDFVLSIFQSVVQYFFFDLVLPIFSLFFHNFFDLALPIFPSLLCIFKLTSNNVYKVQFPVVSACVSEEKDWLNYKQVLLGDSRKYILRRESRLEEI